MRQSKRLQTNKVPGKDKIVTEVTKATSKIKCSKITIMN